MKLATAGLCVLQVGKHKSSLEDKSRTQSPGRKNPGLNFLVNVHSKYHTSSSPLTGEGRVRVKK